MRMTHLTTLISNLLKLGVKLPVLRFELVRSDSFLDLTIVNFQCEVYVQMRVDANNESHTLVQKHKS